MMLVPAGPPVDAVLGEVMPYLRRGDIAIDGGNSHFLDTLLREIRLEEDGIHLLGVGISGGADGVRHDSSIMPGGPREAYERVRPIFEVIAARAPPPVDLARGMELQLPVPTIDAAVAMRDLSAFEADRIAGVGTGARNREALGVFPVRPVSGSQYENHLRLPTSIGELDSGLLHLLVG